MQILCVFTSKLLHYYYYYYYYWCRDSVVGTATSYGLDNRKVGFRALVGSRIFSPSRPERLYDPPSHLSNGDRELLFWGKEVGAWNGPLTSNQSKSTTTPSRRSDWLVKHRDNVNLLLYYVLMATDANKLESIQQRFTTLCFDRIFFKSVTAILSPWKSYNCTLYVWGGNASMHYLLFKSKLVLHSVLLIWELLDFHFLLGISEALLLSMSAPHVTIVLLVDVHQLLMLFAGPLT
jgi:hypothetical protein